VTTLSREVPSLEGRALASNLIIVGRVDAGPLSIPDYTTDPPQVHSTFKVAVEEALRGRPPGNPVTVRILGGQVQDLRTEWTCTMSEGDRVLLFLTPYYAADRDDDTFVPYFRSCYPVSAQDVIQLTATETMDVEGLGAFIQATLQRRDLANSALPEREPEEPEVSVAGLNAMLHVEPGGARWATLDSGEEARRSGG
jgi:hypothetical protein